MRASLLVLFLLGACSSSPKPVTPTEPVAPNGPSEAPPAEDPDAKLSEAECTQLFDHIVELMQAGMPPDEWAAGKDDLAAERPNMIKECQDGETTRAQYKCLMAAKQLNAVKDCVPQQ